MSFNMSEFDILIGVDTSKAETTIENMIDKIGNDYPLHLKLTIDKSEINSEIENIQTLLNNLGSLDINLDLKNFTKTFKEAENATDNMGDNLKDAMKVAKKDAEEFTDEIEDGIRHLRKAIKETTVKDGDGKKRVKIEKDTIGDKYFKQTTTKVNGTPTDDIERVWDIEKKRTDELKKQEQVQKDHQKMQKTIADQKIKFEQKALTIEQEGIAHMSSVKALKNSIAKLDSEELDTLQKVEAQLDKISSQYAKVQNQIKTNKFKYKVQDEVNNANKYIKKNIKPETLGQDDINKLNKSIDNVKNVKSYEQLKNALASLNNVYGELILKQKNSKEEMSAIKSRIKQAEEEAKESNRLMNAQAEKVQKHLDNQAKYKKEHNEAMAKEEKAKADAESKKLNDLAKQRDKHVAEQRDAEAKLEKVMGDGSEKSQLKRKKNDKDAELALHKAISDESQRIGMNQLKINKSTEEWKDLVKEIKSSGYVDEQDFSKANRLIDSLKADSQELNKDLKNVEKALKAVKTLSDSREKNDSSIRLKKRDNEDKVNKLDENDILPKSLVNNFRHLNDMLDFNSSKEDIAEIGREMQKLVNLETELKKHVKDEEMYRKLIRQAELDLVKSVDKYGDKIDEIAHNTNRQIKDEARRNEIHRELSQIQVKVNDAKQKGLALTYQEERALKEQFTALSRNIQRHKDEESAIERKANQIQRLNEQMASVSYRATRGMDRHPLEASKIQTEIAKIQQSINGLATATDDEFDKVLKNIKKDMTELNNMSNDTRDAIRNKNNSLFGKLGHAMQQVPVWISAMTLFYGTMAQIQQGFQNLYEVDKAMTSLIKVTDATNAELEEFRDNASVIGQELGVMTSDVINATAEFQKLGYSLKEATTLGENSIIYANVGEMGVEQATETVVSAVKGFEIEVDKSGKNVRQVVDIFNEVGNNYAISSSGIGEALKRSSAVLNQAGNSIEQSVALVTAANTTIQNPAKVGNALKTISMRLRGVSDDGESVATLVPELERVFNSFGGTVMASEDSFKSTYDIMDTLSKNWDKLTDMEQANLVELIGGKEQGSIVSAMVQNWGDAMGSYESALNSAGSAQREFMKYQESMQYKIGVLKVTVEEFWLTLLDTEAVENLIELLTSLVKLMTEMVEITGGAQVIGQFFGLLLLFGTKTMRELVFGGERFIVTLAGMTTAVKGLGIAIMRIMSWMGMVGLLIAGLEMVWNVATAKSRARKERISEIEDEISAYEQLESKLESLDFDKYYTLDTKKNSTGSYLNTEEMKEYQSMQQRIMEDMPEMISHYDSEGEAVLKNAEAMRILIEEKRKLNLLNREEKLGLQIDEADFGNLEKAINQVKTFSELQGQTRDDKVKLLGVKDLIESELDGIDSDSGEYKERVEDLIDDILKDLQKSDMSGYVFQNLASNVFDNLENGDYETAMESLDALIRMNEEKSKGIDKSFSNAKEKVKNNASEFAIILKDAFSVALSSEGVSQDSNQFKLARELEEYILENVNEFEGGNAKDILKSVPEYISEMLGEVEKQKIDLGELFNANSGRSVSQINADFDSVIAKLDKGNLSSKKWKKVLESLRQELIKTSGAMNGASPEKAFSFAEDVIPVTDKFMDSIAGLDSAYRQLADGQQLSINQIFDLIKQYPQLNKHVENHNGTLRLNKQAIKELASIKEAEFKQSLIIARNQAEATRARAQAEIANILNIGKAEVNLANLRQKTLNQFMAGMKAQLFAQNGNFNSKDPRAMHGSDVMQGKLDEIQGVAQGYIDLGKDIEAINTLLNASYSSNLGSIGSLPNSKDKKEKEKKQLQDQIYVADKYKMKMDELNYQIERQQRLQERYAKQHSSYKKSITEEIRLTNEKKKAIDAQIASLQKQISSRKVVQTGLISVGQEDNRTARAKSAELQSEIDKLKGEVLDLKAESEEAFNRMTELRWNLLEANTEVYEQSRKQYEDDIAYAEYMMELYGDMSKGYVDYANIKMSYMKKQLEFTKQELAYLEKEGKTNKNLTEAQKNELNELIREKRMAVYEISSAIQDMETAIAESNLNQMIDKFTKEADAYANKIDNIRDKLKYDIEDTDYASQIKSLKEILALEKGKEADLLKQRKELEKLRQSYGDNHEMVEKITKELEAVNKELDGTQDNVKDVANEMQDVYEKIADQYVEIYKEKMELLRKAEDEHYQELMKKEEKAHQAKMKNIDDEMEKIRKAYDEKMKLLDREEETRDFENELKRLQDEAKALQKEINLLALDDTYEANAKKEDLMRQLKDKNYEISEKQHDRQIDLRKQDLQDDLEAEEEKYNNKKEQYEEDFENWRENEEKKKEARDQYWEDELNDERKFTEMKKEIMAGNFADMLTNLTDWKTEVAKEMAVLGDSITTNFTDKVLEAIDALTDLKSQKIGSLDGSTSTPATNLDAPKDTVAPLPSDRQPNLSAPPKTTTPPPKTTTPPKTSTPPKTTTPPKPTNKSHTVAKGDTMTALAIKYYGKAYPDWVKIKNANPKVDPNNMKIGTKLIIPFRSGGYTGEWSGDEGRIALLHKKELVLNKGQTSDILQSAKIMEKIKSALPNLKLATSVIPNKEPVQTTNEYNEEINVEVNIESMNGDKKSADIVAEQIVNKIKRSKGGRF